MPSVDDVLAQRELRNPIDVYAARDGADWPGFVVVDASMTLLVLAWVAATPCTLHHLRLVKRVGFALIGPVQQAASLAPGVHDT